jgi:hypothetical protein
MEACSNDSSKRFFTNQKKYTIEEKRKLGKFCIEKKNINNNGETAYLAKAVREFYSDLNSLKNSHPTLQKALRLRFD